MLDIVPIEKPKLQLKVYSTIFEHFIMIKDFDSFDRALSLFPPYMID